MARASYRQAVEWLAYNDDNGWLDEPSSDGELVPSVPAALVADLWGKTDAQIAADLNRALKRRGLDD